jgi:hypothetical protein
LTTKESVILTNLRFIYVYPGGNITKLNSIQLSSIFAFTCEEVENKILIKIFYYPQVITEDLLLRINQERKKRTDADILKCIDDIDNASVFIEMRKKNNLNIKVLSIESTEKRKKLVIKNIYQTFKSKYNVSGKCLQVEKNLLN